MRQLNHSTINEPLVLHVDRKIRILVTLCLPGLLGVPVVIPGRTEPVAEILREPLLLHRGTCAGCSG
jgi:hypothetical protein